MARDQGEVLDVEWVGSLKQPGKLWWRNLQGVNKTNLSFESPSSGCLKPTHMATGDHNSGKTHKLWTIGSRHNFITWLFTLKKAGIPETFDTLLFSRRTICELKHKTPSLRLGKVTLPRGKLECRSYHAKTSSNQICTSWEPWCSAAQKGEWLCRV